MSFRWRPTDVVERHKQLKKQIEDQKNAIDDFVQKHNTELSELLAAKTSRYLMAAWDVMNGAPVDAAKRRSWTRRR